MGLGVWLNTLENTVQQISDVRSIGLRRKPALQLPGNQLERRPGRGLPRLSAGECVPGPALPPEMPWKTRPAGGYVARKVTAATRRRTIYNQRSHRGDREVDPNRREANTHS